MAGTRQTPPPPHDRAGPFPFPAVIQPVLSIGKKEQGIHYPSCVGLTVLRQLFVCEIYSPFDFKRETGWKQDARRGMPEKIRGAYAPVPFWITGLLMVFPKTSADGYFPGGLYMGFLRSSQRPHPVTKAPPKAGWSSRRPSVALTKTAILFLPVHGFFTGFAKTVFRCKRILQAVWSLQRPFQAHTKTICRKEKKLLPGQSLKTDRVTAP